jgi:hypothetical protein
LKSSTTFILTISSFELWINGKSYFTERSLDFFIFQMSTSDPPPLPSSSSGTSLLPALLPLSPAQSISPPPLCWPLLLHLLLPPSPRVTWTPAATLARPCWPSPACATPVQTPSGRHLAAAVARAEQPLRASNLLLSSFFSSCPTQLLSLLLLHSTPYPRSQPPPAPPVRELLAAVDSRRQPPIAPLTP